MLKQNGVKHVVICAGCFGDMLEEYVRSKNNLGLTIEFSFNGDRLLGTAGALKKALPLLGDSFAVMYGDSYLTANFQPIADFFANSDKQGLMTVFRNKDNWDASNIIFADNKIIKYDKKNKLPSMQHIDYGLLFFQAAAL